MAMARTIVRFNLIRAIDHFLGFDAFNASIASGDLHFHVPFEMDNTIHQHLGVCCYLNVL